MHMLVDEIIKKAKEDPGFHISSLSPGTKFLVETRNSKYQFVVLENNEATVVGGIRKDGTVRYTEPARVSIVGSTWGGSCIKVDWIGRDMYIEIYDHERKKRFLTTEVKNAIIEAGDGAWSYSMDWQKD